MAPEKLRILTFPQRIDGNQLEVNVLVLPTTPSLSVTIPFPQMDNPAATIQLPQFINAQPDLRLNLISGLENYPFKSVTTDKPPFDINFPGNLPNKYEGLAGQFEIDPFPKGAGAPKMDSEGIKKYLPESYRNSFNFTNPRTPYAKTDDSYQCAMKKPGVKDPLFPRTDNKISWGRVIAFCLRQQDLAESIGILYRLNITLPNANYFENGGWIYFDLNTIAPEYSIGLTAPDIEKELKIYAARIPQIDPAVPRQLFGAILFPVVSAPSDLKGQFDQLKIEAADYDDGYAKIVHAMQPVSANILAEQPDEIHVQKELGIRLGWDDEQILIWQNRQWLADPTIPGNQRVDAPLGVFSYRVDVRETRQPADPNEPWSSLTRVRNKFGLMLGGEFISDRGKELETGVQVFPTKINAPAGSDFWLPSYFTQWYGQSLVLPDDKAAELDGTGVLANPGSYSNTNKNNKDNITAKPDQKGGLYDAVLPENFELKYGHEYEFRVRLSDLTGGGPRLEEGEINDAPKTSSGIILKRYIAPKQLTLVPLDPQLAQVLPRLPIPTGVTSSKYLQGNNFDVFRPRLGYPALLFTEMDTNIAFQKLIDDKNFLYPDGADSAKVTETRGVGFFDPDVDKMMVIVEVKSLLMDNLASSTQREPYLPLYTTFRNFADDPSEAFTIALEYQNANSIFNPKGDLGDFAAFVLNIDDNDAPIVVPTSREVRITLVPVCSEKNAPLSQYFGFNKTNIGGELVHAGEQIQFFVRQQADEEIDFLLNELDSRELRGIYLQPDPIQVKNFATNTKETAEGKESEQVSIIKRLSSALDVGSTKMTLIGKPGERIVFGCSNRIRHTLAPDNSSLTFSAKNDLFNHWLCVVSLNVNRDWSWDGLNSMGIEVRRTKKFTGENDTEVTETVGYIQPKKTASRLAIDNAPHASMPDRSYTRIVFIDAVEPKKELGLPSTALHPFPNTIDVEYSLFTNYDILGEPDPVSEEIAQPNIVLPVTTVPTQVPKIVAAGIALSPFKHNSEYSETAFRKRYLWLEFEEEIKDPNDTYFARVLTYAPDPLLAFPNPDQLLIKQEEPPLPIPLELIRIITESESNDFAGLDGMQFMEGETADPGHPLISVSKLHYLLPLPPGLHEESNELFGFFKYEVRVGHTEKIWCTAQGRFGLQAGVNGVQHPAPPLKCLVNQTTEGITATAQYALALFNGKNVTSKPPKTEIWCMLYAQARQADGSINRNILLDDRKLEYIDPELQNKFNVGLKAFISNQQKYTDIKQANSLKINLDAPSTGKVSWSKAEINQLLDQYNLSHDSGLSVLAVEMMPRYDQYILKGKDDVAVTDNIRPLSSQLGQYRILRTSPLAPAPAVCCEDCA
ncbi:MAG: hypothetical protein ABI594_03080 [Ginsengibacter sp.]